MILIKKIQQILLSFLLIMPLTASADSTLSWSQCQQEASEQNPDIQSSLASVQAAEAQVRVASSGFYPQLSTSLTSTTTNAPNSGTVKPVATNQEIKTTTWSFNLSQNIWSGGQDLARVKQAKANRDVAQTNLDIARAKLSKELKSAFLQLQYTQKLIRLSEEIVSRREQNSRLVYSLYKNGQENEGSYLQAQSLLEQSKLDFLQAEHAKVLASESLSVLLGRKPSETLEVTGSPPVSEPPAVDDFEPLALATPQRRQAWAQLQAAQSASQVAHGAYFPTLDANGSLSNNENYLFEHDNRWNVGITLSLPLFSGFKYSGAYEVAQAQQRAATYTLSSLEHQLITQLKQSYFAFREAIQKQKVDEAFAKAMTVRQKIAQKKYHISLMSFENWDLIESDLIVRQRAVLQSQRDRLIAQAAWEQAQGKADLP